MLENRSPTRFLINFFKRMGFELKPFASMTGKMLRSVSVGGDNVVRFDCGAEIYHLEMDDPEVVPTVTGEIPDSLHWEKILRASWDGSNFILQTKERTLTFQFLGYPSTSMICWVENVSDEV